MYEIIHTNDHSHTIYVPELDEHYHSVNGAIQESRHVYIEAGLNQCYQNPVFVLEIGFGTGLNALLSAMEAEKRNIRIKYFSIEKYPLPESVTAKLNYISLNKLLFSKIHAATWNQKADITSFFSLHKIEADLHNFPFPEQYDVVFYDAFGPDKQPDVWSQEIFDRIFSGMNPEGILTTYCAKGEVRRMLQRAGFTVERIPGPPGKREMLRGRKL